MIKRLAAFWSTTATIVIVTVTAWANSQPEALGSGSTEGVGANLLDILKVAGGVIGVLFGAAGVFAYWRVMTKTGAERAYQATIKAQGGQIDAMASRIDQLVEDSRTLAANNSAKEQLVEQLRTRTDLTAVLSTLNDFIKSSELRHLEVNRLDAERYNEGMQIMKKLLETVVNDQHKAFEVIQANQAVLMRLITSGEQLSRRFGEIEDRIAEVHVKIGAQSPVLGDVDASERRRLRR